MRIKLGVPLSLQEIAYASKGQIKKGENAIISAVTTDTREMDRGDLFIALKGKNFDGENYTQQAKRMGCYTLSSSSQSADIYHPRTSEALLCLAEYYSKNLPYILYNIGITGSVGKTTTKEFLKIILSQKFKTHSSVENFNNEIGMPMSILAAPKKSEILIMEMGMNHIGEISRLSKCLHPNIGIITNIGTAHIGNLGSRENIAKAKLEIQDGMMGGKMFVPYEEPLLFSARNKITFSSDNSAADYSLIKNESRQYLHLTKNGKPHLDVSFSLAGEHNRKCLVAAIAVATDLGISPKGLTQGVSQISSDNIRQKRVVRENYTFYADLYNASFESVMSCIKNAEEMVKSKNKSLVLGDILESGNMSQSLHFDIGKSINQKEFNYIFLFGIESKNIMLGAIEGGFPSERIFFNDDISSPQKTAEQIRTNCPANEAIFMKGSRGMKLERILDCFKKE